MIEIQKEKIEIETKQEIVNGITKPVEYIISLTHGCYMSIIRLNRNQALQVIEDLSGALRINEKNDR